MTSLRKDAKLTLLEGVQLFAGFSKKELSAVARAADQVDYPDGAYLGRQDAGGHEAFVIVSGGVTVRRNRRKVASLRPGDVAGEMSLIDGQPRSADLIAAGDTSVLVIPRREFSALLDGNAQLANKLLRTLADRLREADRSLYG